MVPSVSPVGPDRRTSASSEPATSTATAPDIGSPAVARAMADSRESRATVSRSGAGGAPTLRRISSPNAGPMKGDVGQATTELLGHDGRLDAGGQRRVGLGRYTQATPPAHHAVQLVGPVEIVELAHGLGSQPVDGQRDRVAQGLLLGGEPDVHQPPVPAAASVGAHSSRSTRRSTLPDGSRGMSSTTTTCRSCL